MESDMKNGTILDTENTSDVERAHAICDYLADILITELSDFHVAQFHTNPKRNFTVIMENILNGANLGSDITRFVDVSKIELYDRIGNRSLWEWAKNISRIDNQQKLDVALSVFKSEFFNKYSRIK